MNWHWGEKANQIIRELWHLNPPNNSFKMTSTKWRPDCTGAASPWGGESGSQIESRPSSFLAAARNGEQPPFFICNLSIYTGCPRKKSLIKFFLDDFPTDVDYGPTFSWTVKHPWRPGHSLKKVAGRPLASAQVSGDKVCSWSVVHVRWEVVEEKFYQRLFSGTPCSFLYKTDEEGGLLETERQFTIDRALRTRFK